ncbi:MAG: hypothetical protein DHS20C19_17840 [Acidimicrobiales bacterium]|nr:MAG: hypothetical protein DHS20C19_17840 [Acidimicrobiales bacterium]
MTPEEARLQFRHWLIDHELEPEVAYAILESMPPFDWSEIAKKSDVEELRQEMAARFDAIDRRFEGTDQRLEGTDQRLDGIDQRLEGIDQRFDGISHRFDALTERFDATRLSIEAQMVALEGRLSMRWMETTRIIVFALITLFVAVAGVVIGVTG